MLEVLTSSLTWLSLSTTSSSPFLQKNVHKRQPQGTCSLRAPIPLCYSPAATLVLPSLLGSSSPTPLFLLTQNMQSPGDVAMPVRAKLLAAGDATCAYQISAKAVAFPECTVLGNWKVIQFGSSNEPDRRESFSLGSIVWRKLWSGVADGPKSLVFTSSKAQMQPKWFLS